MELKDYLRIVSAKRWIVLATFLATLCATLLFTLGQTPVYQSVATYVVKTNVVKPNVSEPDVRTLSAALDVLNRGQVGQTVAEVATSHMIRVDAARELGLASDQVRDLSVTSRPLAGTNVVEIAVEAPSPALARDFASVIGAHTSTFFEGIYGMYRLEILDEPRSPLSPTKPRTMLNLLLGAAAGLVLGVGLAFLSAYLQTSSEGDEREPGTARDRTVEPTVEISVGRMATAAAAGDYRARTDGSAAEAQGSPHA